MAKDSKKALIIGGGIAGMSAARELANNGVEVTLVEREPNIGGYGARFCCKASEECNKCSVCLINYNMDEIAAHPGITLLANSEVKGLTKSGDGFEVKLSQRPRFVDSGKCTACGLCTEKCPTEPKAIKLPQPQSVPNSYYIDVAKCLNFQGKDCRVCQEVCPVKAVDLKEEARESTLTVDSVIVATGFKPFDPSEKRQYGYGRMANVITALELEEQFRFQGKLTRPSDGKEPKSVAFIQCVGSRDIRQENSYCSRYCCAFAMRSARLIRDRLPETDVSIFYMDLQSAGKGFNEFYEKVRKEVDFIHAMPGNLDETPTQGIIIGYEDIAGGKICQKGFDLVVLSVGITPNDNAENLAETLGIKAGEDGFYQVISSNGSLKAADGAIFLAGACQGPKDINSSIAQGMRAAEEVVSLLTSKN
ncbi:MAG: CoB--CoM heterodisulfide reductase iron-sulfur subunit A family protein [Deltaproteobacteria bacterium]|nr:MAG: CoB--CoM heterodisulfide reductase iron-sulfur subunit A family protein [Deltaproteobacteria bacterium]